MENIPHAFACYLLDQIDTMVKDPSDPEYLAIRAEMLRRMNRAEVKNPFKAGAPAKYEEDMEDLVNRLKKGGKKTRQIAAEAGCSQSTVVRLLNRKYTSRKA